MRRLFLIPLCCSVLAAQVPSDIFNQAPPDVDQALRARVAKYYQAFVDGKFRLADEVVHEDSKDYFFAMEKGRYKNYEIIRLNYEKNFTRAVAVVQVGTEVMIRGNPFQVKAPVTSRWKLEGGQWFWYFDASLGTESPMGRMTPGPTEEGRKPGSIIPKMDEAVKNILAQVRVDKTAVNLSSYQPGSDTVTVTSSVPGKVDLRLEFTTINGFSAALEKAELSQGDRTKIQFQYKPPDGTAKTNLTVYLLVEPLHHVIPIQVTFAVPPDVERQLPDPQKP